MRKTPPMRQIEGKLEGDQHITDDLAAYGMIAGNATVAAGGFLRVYGMITGDLRLEPGARAEVLGTVSGSVSNEGTIDVKGIVAGTVAGSGRTTIDPDAIVGRR